MSNERVKTIKERKVEEKITVRMTDTYLFDFTLYHTYSKLAGFLTNILGAAIAFMGIIMLAMGKIKPVQIIFYLVAAAVTNSLLVGNELAAVRHVELYMIGGHVGGHLAATMGDAAIENMEKFHVDKGFIGVHSINFDVGLTSIATPQMQVKRAIFEASQQVFVLADSSKFGGGYVSVICPVKDVYKIITDSQISKEYIRKAEHEQILLVIAGNREQ